MNCNYITHRFTAIILAGLASLSAALTHPALAQNRTASPGWELEMEPSEILPQNVFLNDVWQVNENDLFTSGHDRANYDPQQMLRAAQAGSPRVKISWRTTRENDLAGFYILRADNPEGRGWLRLNPEKPLLEHISNSEDIHQYFFYDLDVDNSKTYYYRVFAFNLMREGFFVIGGKAAASAKPKPLGEKELLDIRERGYAGRASSNPAQQTTSTTGATSADPGGK